MPEPALPTVGVVVLTQGTRPAELARAIESVLRQDGVSLDVVVVGNGWSPVDLPVGVRGVALETNVGIPAGRNRGAEAVAGGYIFFLDDDASIPEPSFLLDCIELCRLDNSIGLIQPRLDALGEGEAPTRWIPRIRKGDPRRSSAIFSCLEAAVFLPRPVFDAAGGWAEPFFYAHEGIELAWRVWDQGRRAWYAGDLEARHPVVQQTRHTEYYRLNARNRVWLARRNLPAILMPFYVGSWTGIQLLRWRSNPPALRAWFGGWREGWRTPPGGRQRMRWRTIWRMTAAGRPPLV